MFIKKILSYLFPIHLKKYPSYLHGVLSIDLVNGKKVLNTEKSNYSYGSLQKILQRGLTEIGLDSRVESILVLGLGGGGIVETIREDFHILAPITLVDIDPLILSIAKDVFHIERFENIKMIESDALDYLQKSSDHFDCIIVDIFIIDTIPVIFTQKIFIEEVSRHLHQWGKLIYNTLRNTMPVVVLEEIQKKFRETGLQVRVVKKVAGSNDLIIAEKI